MGRKGYSLVEMLIVVALFSLLFSIVFTILATGRRSWDIGSTQQDIENQARQGLEFMVKELYSTNPGRLNISNNRITFQVPIGYDDTGNLLWGAEGTKDKTKDNWIRYEIVGRQLIRQVLDQTNNILESRVLANDIESVIWSLSSNRLTINLTAQKNTPAGTILSRELTTQVTLRN